MKHSLGQTVSGSFVCCCCAKKLCKSMAECGFTGELCVTEALKIQKNNSVIRLQILPERHQERCFAVLSCFFDIEIVLSVNLLFYFLQPSVKLYHIVEGRDALAFCIKGAHIFLWFCIKTSARHVVPSLFHVCKNPGCPAGMPEERSVGSLSWYLIT